MPDPSPLRYANPSPEELRQVLRQPHAFDPPLRVLAEDVLAADSRIDLVSVDAMGRIVLVLVGELGDDSALLTRGLAQRAWVKPRIRDWLQLGADLQVSASAPVVARLLSPGFSPETRAAAEAVGPDAVELWSCRCVRNGAELGVLLEALTNPVSATSRGAADESSGESREFRSGLSEEDLGLSPEEIRDFD
jgi:hypothetical protein